MTPTLTVKSQFTVPKAIREFLNLQPGERVKFEPMADGSVATSHGPGRHQRHHRCAAQRLGVAGLV